MTEKVRMPADLDKVSLKLLGKFDTKDLARFALPSTVAFGYVYSASNPSIAAYTSLVLAAVFGTAWAIWRPFGRTLDQNLYQGVRWTAQRRNISSPEMKDGCVVSDGSVAALIEVEPVNLELKSGKEKAALHKQYQELVKSVDYPITAYSTQHPFRFDSYFEERGEDEDEIQRDYRTYCEGLIEDGQSKVRHLFEIQAGDRAELENRVEEVLEQLNSGALSAHQVTEPSRKIRPEPEINNDHIVYSDAETRRYSKTLYISEYPREVDFSWISQILQVEGLVDVTQVVKPRNAADTVSRLQKTENKAEAENQSLVRKGYGSSRRLERLLNDVDWFQNLLADQDDQPVEYGVYITAYGESLEACEDTLRQVETRLKTLGIKYRDTGLRTDQAHCSTTPGLRDKLGEVLLVPAGSAASGFPFAFPSSIDENGVLFGVDDNTESPVILDRFKWNAGHQVLAGVTGSGKSFYSKLLLLRSTQIYDDLHINIVDPKPEYGEISEKLENYASVTRFAQGGSIKDDTEDLIQAVGEAYKDAQENPDKTIVVIDEAHRLLKDEEGASVLSTLVREARSSNTAVTLITQTIGDFYRTEDGEDILKNIPCKVLFAHEEADDRPAQAFRLSNVAETSLYNLTKGDEDSADHSQAILAVSNQIESQLKIQASPVETSIIETGELPEDGVDSSRSSGTDYSLYTTHSSDEETGRAEKLIESVSGAISEIERPSLPEVGFLSENESNDPSQLSYGEDDGRNWSLPSVDLDRVSAVLKKVFQAIAVLVLLLFGIAVVESIWTALMGFFRSNSRLAGPLLFTVIIGAVLVYITAKDIYSSREDSFREYTVKQVFTGLVVHTVVFWLMAAFLIGAPLRIVAEVAQAVPPGQTRTGIYVAAAALELGIFAKLGETEEDEK